MDPQNSSSNEAIRALLLADHAHFSNMLEHNEQSGETRVNWFIGIVTATVGGLLALIVKYQESKQTLLDPALLFAIVFAAACGLLAFGIITLMRMMLRNSSTDRQKRSLDQVRQMFEDYFDPQQLLLSYFPLGVPQKDEKETETAVKVPAPEQLKEPESSLASSDEKDSARVRAEFWRQLKSDKKKGRLRKLGGLAHTVATINSVLVGAVVAMIVYAGFRVAGISRLPEPNWQPLLFWAIGILVVCLLSFVLQWVWITYSEIQARYKIQKGDCTHAGGVVFSRDTDRTVVYLLVRPEDATKNEWVLPKGKIEEGELHRQTALREVREETGVDAKIVGQLDQVEFEDDAQLVRAKFYLMEKQFEDVLKPRRKTKWKQYTEAYNLLTYSESKQLLRLAKDKMGQQAG